MAIKKKYPKEHGSDNIYIDAAVEAMQQAREEDPDLSYMILVHDKEKHGIEMLGDCSALASSLACMARQNSDVMKMLCMAAFANKMAARKAGRDDILELLNKSEKLMDGYLDELKRLREE